MECRPDLSALTSEELEDLLDSANRIQECCRVLGKGGLNLVGEVLKGQGTFYEMEHYPKGDVFDPDSRSQYYYHAHRPDTPEHGHFHTFLTVRNGEHEEDQLMHLVAISMNAWGHPTGLFTTNRWVTDETWHSAEQVIPRLGEFEIDHASPSWPLNIWITHFVRLHRFHIAALLVERDRVLRSARSPLDRLLENRDLEVLSECRVDVAAWKQQVARVLLDRS
ncbi:DUF6969 family protein [Marinobacter orientalis]|uniref:DUF6969 domain-containing protein n=1 Tax=Marinobacter orientalis TaxID=1928859 RepID=A0A7Y0RBH7_9GAMM|nr:hypothetical protein [Marinobacter orientalis]NMT63167.1 hypothetical protein [Marinobacter orientalis]TGX51823.1 hypothetical protein DIT72_07355 [Marinobacter orientalis]